VTVLHLLIADDDAGDATLIAYKLERAGYQVEWQRVDREADFARELPTADLVICDYAMPAFSPARALAQIRERGLDTPLLLISGSITPAAAHELVALGAVDYLLKDKLEGLGAVVHDALAARRARSVATAGQAPEPHDRGE